MTGSGGAPKAILSLNRVPQMLFDFGYGVLGEVLVEFADDPTPHVGVKGRAKLRQRAGWRDDNEGGRMLAAKETLRRSCDLPRKALLLELMPIGHFHRTALLRMRSFADPTGAIATL